MRNIAEVPTAKRRRTVRALLTGVAIVCAATALAGCGGGLDVVVIAEPPPPSPNLLSIRLSRVGPEAVQVDWSDDPDVHQFTVERNGYTLANVMSISLIDASVTTNVQYCYQVSGYSLAGDLIAASYPACIVLAP
jgi:hypothetical protein